MKKLPLALLALVLSTPFWDLGHPLWEVDDARYAQVPRELHERGWPLIPTLNGMDYVEKPPLIYWLGAASYAAFGVSEAAGRLPLALAALAALGGVWWLGGWLYAPAVGRAGAVVLATMLVFAGLAHLITPDMTLTAALVWATALALRALYRPDDARWAAPAAWACASLAFLSKGLVALVLPAAWTTALAVLDPKLRTGYFRHVFGPGPLLFAAAVVPWLKAMEEAAPGFWRVFFLEQHFQRFLDTAKYNRPGGWWYFPAEVLWGSLPWTPLVVAALWDAARGWRGTDRRALHLALWPAVVVGFFSTSSSKLPTYILPAFPFLALLVAPRLVADASGKAERVGGAVLGAVLALAAGAAPLLLPRFEPAAAGPALWLAAGAVLALAAGAFLAPRPGGAPRAALCAALFLGLTLAAARGKEELVSARPVSRALAEALARAESETPDLKTRVVAYDRYLHGVPFYTGREVDVVNWVGELHYAQRFERFAARFGDDDEIRAWPNPGERVFVVAPAKETAWVERTRGGPGSLRGLETVGPYAVFELTPKSLTAPTPRPGSASGRAPGRG